MPGFVWDLKTVGFVPSQTQCSLTAGVFLQPCVWVSKAAQQTQLQKGEGTAVPVTWGITQSREASA